MTDPDLIARATRANVGAPAPAPAPLTDIVSPDPDDEGRSLVELWADIGVHCERAVRHRPGASVRHQLT
jgi:hypothetical protein